MHLTLTLTVPWAVQAQEEDAPVRPRGAHSGGGAHMPGGHAMAAAQQQYLHPHHQLLQQHGLPPGTRLSAEQVAMLEAQAQVSRTYTTLAPTLQDATRRRMPIVGR